MATMVRELVTHPERLDRPAEPSGS
jgi:hypothetical protein